MTLQHTVQDLHCYSTLFLKSRGQISIRSSWQTEKKRALDCEFLPPIPLPQEAFKNKVVNRTRRDKEDKADL